jgi:hypothetical protein
LFVVRDLSMYFWPKHRWLRDTILSGQWPWWDPYVAAGQSTAADALLQMFFLPTLLLRLLLPEVLGFNLWVGLPFPLAALGLYLFARRHLSRQGAAVAAIVFAGSGPVVSTGNFLNLSWSVAAVPWILWATGRVVRRPSARAFVVLTCFVAAQILSSEPVTMATTMALAVAYGAWCLIDAASGLRASLRAMGVVVAAIVAGVALSAIQLVPLLHAAAHSSRSGGDADQFWSVHPVSLVETVAPFLFGDYLQWFSGSFPWMRAFGGGREPFFFSVYCGVAAFALALVGVCAARRRWAVFWAIIGLLALALALGGNTPFYPALQQVVPLMRSFRYPTKYLVFTVLALAMLAGHGWHALTLAAARREPLARRAKMPAIGLAVSAALVGYAATLTALLFPAALTAFVARIAMALRVPDLPFAVSWIVGSAEPHGRRLLLLSSGVAFLLWVAAAGKRESRLACVVLFGTLCADLVVTNAHINIQMPVAYLDKPQWVRYVQDHPSDRFYFGGRVRGGLDPRDIDSPVSATISGAAPSIEIRTMMQGRSVPTSSGWRVRDAISYDLPNLFPFDYERFVVRFEAASRMERLRFLSNVGVRYCVLPVPPRPEATVLSDVPALNQMYLYECNASGSRVQVVPPWGMVEPDAAKQIDLLFRPTFDAHRMVLLFENPPRAAGVAGPAVPSPYARFIKDGQTDVEVAAGVGAEGGFLVLNDTFDDDWHVDVDGHPAPLLKANALYRAVRLVPGEHKVAFRYRPRPVLYGALLSGGAFIGLSTVALLGALVGSRRRRISSVEVPLSVASHVQADGV